MKKYVVVFAVLLAGCSTVALNNANSMKDEDLMILWVHQDMLNPFKIVSYNNDTMRQTFLAKVKDVPGHKDVRLEMWHKYVNKEEKKVNIQFQFSFNAKAGYSYNLKLEGANFTAASNAARLCLLSEPHDSLGSEINGTGEYRKPSANAEIISCSNAEIIEI